MRGEPGAQDAECHLRSTTIEARVGPRSPAGTQNIYTDLHHWCPLRPSLLEKAATKLFRDFSKIPEGQRNTSTKCLVSAQPRKRYPNWETDALAMLESLRVTYDFWAHSPDFVALKNERCSISTEIKRWWRAHEIRTKHSGEKALRHKRFGEKRLRCSTFQWNENPDLKLVLYSRLESRRDVTVVIACSEEHAVP